ncbi:MAG: transcription antitermination factor NusB [Acetatifactor sp.]
MGRHELREQVFMLLFQVEFHSADNMPGQIKLFLENSDSITAEKDSECISERYRMISEKIPEIDKLINDNTEGWDTTRMGKVELTVLRLAVYEMCYDDDIPERVAIDEAVEIAKKYGQENSGSFVNAILAKIMKLGD